jgi:hypothetical protein
VNFEVWRSFDSCRSLVLFVLFLSLSYSFSTIMCNEGGEGELFCTARLETTLDARRRSETRCEPIAFLCQNVRNSREHFDSSCAQLEISLVKQAHIRTHSSTIIREQSHSNFVRLRRDVIHRCTRDKGLFHSIQKGGVSSGRLRSSYLLKNGPKVYLIYFGPLTTITIGGILFPFVFESQVIMGTVQSDSLLDFDTRIIIPIEEN